MNIQRKSGVGAVLAVAVLLASPTTAEPCLRIDQVVKGAPGLEPGQVLKQRLWISPVWLRLDEVPVGGSAYQPRYLMLADQDPVAIIELKAKTHSYRQWEELMNLQADRTMYERDVLISSQELPAEERERMLAHYHLKTDADGRLKRDIEVNQEPSPPITLDKEQYPCRRVVVKENDRVIVDARVTDKIGRGIDYYLFYRQLGVFSDQVLDELRKISAFPLRAKICMVTGKLKGEFNLDIQVTAVATDDLPKEAFNIPEGWTKEEEIPLKTTCANRDCNKELEPRNLPTGGRKYFYRGKWRYFCSKECYRTFRRNQGRVGRGNRALLPRQSGTVEPPKNEGKGSEKK